MSYSLQFMETHGTVQLGETETEVSVGVAHELSEDLIRTLGAFHGKQIRRRVLDSGELRSRIQQAAASRSVPSSEATSGVPAPPARKSDLSIDEIAEDAPAVNLVNALLNDAVRSRASDIHLEAHGVVVTVRYRIDGRLLKIARLPSDRFAGISARLKVLSGINPSERRRPQDGRFSAGLSDDTFDIRFSSLPTIGGESLVLRLFRQSRDAFTIYDLGLSDAALFEIRSTIQRASGFLLVSGPTGSGKTTTLHACLRHISSDERKIVTIEDPVEYHLPEIDQVQTNPAVGLTFDSILRRVLRQDPNVIMVGEIRDSETANLAVRAAITGHLVLSTVHARSAADVTDRLVSLGVDERLLRSVSPVIVEQRLVRVRCTKCDGARCSACRNTGFNGRTAIFGVLTSTGESMSIVGDGLRKVVAGRTTHEEVVWATVA